tara:strand:- start:48 stop:422 length:375 start_codon:yes stop_codon:yes gene_type:complete
MAKPEWGIKRICPACGLKYYDFNNLPITCPACNTEFDPDIYLKSRKGKSFAPKVVTDNNDDDISNLDDIEVENDEEVVSDEDSILGINKNDKNEDNVGDDSISDDINFVEDDNTSIEITEEKKD